MSIPLLLGPIDSGSSFNIVSIQNNQPFVLNGAQITGGGIIYYWESNIAILAASTNLPTFSASGNVDSLTISDTVNGGGVAFRADGVTIGNAQSPIPIKLTQPSFANWWPPDILLSRAIYTIFNGSGATGAVLITTSGTGPTIPANNIIILPTLWYFACTSAGFNELKPTTSPSTLNNWFCAVNPGITGCTGAGGGLATRSGWTNLNDCNIGNNYTYCPVGDVCGDSNCKGPCPVPYYDCNFASGNYECFFDVNKFLPGTNWWNSPYFVASITTVVLSIIIFIIVIIIVDRKQEPAKK